MADKLRGRFKFGLGAPAAAAQRVADTVFILENQADAAAAMRAAFPDASCRNPTSNFESVK